MKHGPKNYNKNFSTETNCSQTCDHKRVYYQKGNDNAIIYIIVKETSPHQSEEKRRNIEDLHILPFVYLVAYQAISNVFNFPLKMI